MKILVIEDEKKVANFIKQALVEQLYTVDVAYDGEKGLEMGLSDEYDLIVLDIMLPKIDGYEIIKKIRSENITTPILVLTAKDTVSDKVKGLDIGADDYLCKPFVLEELFARIRSLLRRQSVDKSNILKLDNLELDTISHTAKRGDKKIEFTAREYELLEFLLRNKNRVLTRSIIAQHVWEYNFDVESNIVDVYINRLRNKIDFGDNKKLIHSIKGVGYVMKVEDD
ncbi:MAG TPA: response regulator transcription factor [Bacteroidota bacterium]|nr:response regulator transcription factor [Bacteroidota bacterium]